ncbi:MAG TPA: hypothetical protein VLF40_03190 [Candidatus Saccharimonadales bacterium]|nr:hypothetical protein [Candidatus Saccharimonadales bacterium]
MADPQTSLNPYEGESGLVLRDLFERDAVSRFENEIGAPRFYALLPSNGIRRVMDFGCGPHSPTILRERYPDAEILGVDKSEAMLPNNDPTDPLSRYALWSDATSPRAFGRQYGKFDLIVLKMVAQYVDRYELYQLLYELSDYSLAYRGYIALSVPHPEDSAQFVTDASELSDYTRTIGGTGLRATMVHRPMEKLIDLGELARALPDGYRQLVDEPADAEGHKKRLNILFRPPTMRERLIDSLRQELGARVVGRRVWLTPGEKQRYGYLGRQGKPLMVPPPKP